MKGKICIILTFIFSFVVINAFPVVSWSYSDFYLIEQSLSKDISFVENGVKVEYETNESIEETLNSILNQMSKYYDNEILQVSKDSINVELDKSKINVNFYNNHSKNLVEIIITNFSKEKNILNLMQDLSQLQVNTLKNPRYFQYLKGKINTVEDGISLITKENKIEDIDTLDVHNGYVGTGKLPDKERVNFAVSTYDSGTYLVIGTPIIFSTY